MDGILNNNDVAVAAASARHLAQVARTLCYITQEHYYIKSILRARHQSL